MSIILAMLIGAQAAPPPGVHCVLNLTPTRDRPELVRDIMAQQGGTRIRQFQEAARRCAAERSLGADQTATFAGWAASIVLLDETAAQLRRASVSTDAINAWFDRQSQTVRTNPVLEEQLMEGLLGTLQGQGHARATLDAQAASIGVYLGARIMIERFSLGLPPPQ